MKGINPQGIFQAFRWLHRREERRQHQRQRVSGLVGFAIDDSVFSGLLKNMSLGGIFIQTNTQRIVRSVYTSRAARDDSPIVRFAHSFASTPRIRATGHIVRMNKYGIGVEFVSVQEGFGYLSGLYNSTQLTPSTTNEKGNDPSRAAVLVSSRGATGKVEDRQLSSIKLPPNSDMVLRAKIVGTWVSRYPQLGGGETTYFIDGYAIAFVYGDLPELIPPNARIRGAWNIHHRRLTATVLETNPPGLLPIGHTSTSRIECINDEELVLITEHKVRLVEKRRDKNAPAN